MLLDRFGEGWSGTALYVYDTTGIVESFSPTCTVNPLYAKYCFDSTIHVPGDQITVVVNGITPEWTSEVY